MMLQMYSYFLPFPGDRGACVIFFHCVCILRWKICSGCRGASVKCVRLAEIEVVGSARKYIFQILNFPWMPVLLHMSGLKICERRIVKRVVAWNKYSVQFCVFLTVLYLHLYLKFCYERLCWCIPITSNNVEAGFMYTFGPNEASLFVEEPVWDLDSCGS